VPWLRRLAAGLPTRRPGLDPGSVHVGFVVDKVTLGQVFPPSSSVFPCQFHSTGAPLLGKGQEIIFTVIFIIGLHNKPHGCGASVTSAAGPFTIKKTPWNRALIDNPVAPQIVKKFPVFYITPRFITVFTAPSHFSFLCTTCRGKRRNNFNQSHPDHDEQNSITDFVPL
jgi:hypothetical protein